MLVLHHYLGMRSSIAEVLGVPVGTVHSRLHYASTALRSVPSRMRVPRWSRQEGGRHEPTVTVRCPAQRLAEEGPTTGPDDLLADVHARARTVRQRPGRWLALKGDTMTTTWRARPAPFSGRLAFILLTALLLLVPQPPRSSSVPDQPR